MSGRLVLPLALLASLGACDSRLDGEDEPSPFADGQTAPQIEGSATAPPSMDPPAMQPGSDEPLEVDAGDEDFDDGPYNPSGFDPSPVDDGAGFDPTPQDFLPPGDDVMAD